MCKLNGNRERKAIHSVINEYPPKSAILGGILKIIFIMKTYIIIFIICCLLIPFFVCRIHYVSHRNNGDDLTKLVFGMSESEWVTFLVFYVIVFSQTLTQDIWHKFQWGLIYFTIGPSIIILFCIYCFHSLI